ncbi:extracellular solute-binding protein [Bradyrhizobium sp. ISRA443]|uniref:extracellular solute-binding protein n=1 Tax=unclassified Bradyrhizobium TaxID=2631580 RepID=UPI00247A4F36|nr:MULTISPECIES: extracellular solute-binding protein [unclassified Bradyrhizobium]WGR91920.1 extracellular solute-binding protein [Bradyrhizobium sp. ISRA435]WGS02312.1 extracellular solute-binding protein [Bradyrhizobium sp. ISRA436]WGS09197.1 extracellular solute-binding protein [Bradyrhizobium sp. ISRA437]WGS16086.1 extracellular solute-binding protein [Bradyrhizobium sp. ISRA443]
MQDRKWSRRDWLKATAATAAGMVFAEPLKAAAPPAAAVTPELIAAAQKEGKVSYYSALELNTAERLARAFEQKYPGISVRVERSGAERIFQRIAQEQGSGINAVDVANSTDPAHYLDWKKNGWLAAYLPEDVAKHYPADQIDPDGTYATSCAWFEVIGYNTEQVKPEEAPRSYADLLDPKWRGKLVKAHPSYSGAILTATFVLARDLGWPYLEKLAQQRVMQVQSAADPPKKILLGERAVMADGNDYNLVLAKEQGKPVEVVYPAEGAPLIIVPSGIFKSAPNPNAAKLFQNFFFSAETQQMLADEFAHRSFHAQVKEKAGHVPLDKLKLLKADPAEVQTQSEQIKARYAKLFRV